MLSIARLTAAFAETRASLTREAKSSLMQELNAGHEYSACVPMAEP